MKRKAIKMTISKMTYVLLIGLLINTPPKLRANTKTSVDVLHNFSSNNDKILLSGEIELRGNKIDSYNLTASQDDGIEKEISDIELIGTMRDNLTIIITFSDNSEMTSCLEVISSNNDFMKCIPKECGSQ